MRLHGRTAINTAVLACAALIVGTPVVAAEPAYVGLWSKRMEHCSTQQTKPGAPMVVTEQGFDQHDLHCTFAEIEPVAGAAAPEWSILADCTWGKTPTKMEMTWSVSGETLSIVDKAGINQLKKCIAPPPATK